MHYIATHAARNPHDLHTTIIQPTHAAHLQSVCTLWLPWPPHAHPCGPQSSHGHHTTTMQPAHPHTPNHAAYTSRTASMQPTLLSQLPCSPWPSHHHHAAHLYLPHRTRPSHSSCTPPSQLKAILTCTPRLAQHHHVANTPHSSPTTSIWPPQSPHSSPTQSSHISQLTTHFTICSHVAEGFQMATKCSPHVA